MMKTACAAGGHFVAGIAPSAHMRKDEAGVSATILSGLPCP
jgi:hypothetical protein